ncbi:hypothetical protein Hdeb2414_s0016g00488781 [Helianthus debilis subsp. tardiflorus]
MNKTKLLHCLQSGRGTLCCHLQMLQPLSWMHRQELCKEHYILEDYTGDFHIQTHIVAEMVCLAHRRDGVLVRSKCFPSCLRDSILLWQNTMLQSGQRTGRFRCNQLCKEVERKDMVNWYRCDCLGPIFPSRYHCVKCHETFFMSVESEHHKNSS